jgi:putative SOS response-associated peptidase YedK
LKSGQPFALAGIWETWLNPATNEETRNFAIITCPPNEMMATIHDRMPVLLHPEDYKRWLSDEPDPADLLKPFPAELMTMWPIGRGVGSPRNDSPDILDEVEPDEGPEPDVI